MRSVASAHSGGGAAPRSCCTSALAQAATVSAMFQSAIGTPVTGVARRAATAHVDCTANSVTANGQNHQMPSATREVSTVPEAMATSSPGIRKSPASAVTTRKSRSRAGVRAIAPASDTFQTESAKPAAPNAAAAMFT